MLEQTVNLTIEEAYPKLKAVLVEKGCRVLSEEEPRAISFKQGSLWGLTPKTAKKTVTLTLEPAEHRTLARCTSKLSSDWKNITLIGCALAAALAFVCVWMALDLGAVLAGGDAGFWSWLVTVNGSTNSAVGGVFVTLLWGLAAFLFVVIVLEAAIVVYSSRKIDAFAGAVLGQFN